MTNQIISKNIVFVKVRESDQYLLKLHGRVLYVSDFLHFIINALVTGVSVSAMVVSINESRRFSVLISEQDVEKIITEKILPLKLYDVPEGNTAIRKDIKYRIVLFNYKNIKWLLGYGKQLFHPIFFIIMLVMSGIFTIGFGLFHNNESLFSNIDILHYLLFTICIFPVVLLHELGHASAAYFFGVKPKEIGIGMYLIFPVFYADVTDVWELAPWQRIIVNLGGVFIQLLINLFLLACLLLITTPKTIAFIQELIVFNTLTVLTNLNPFFKFDGYWVYADLFDLPNLRVASTNYIRQARISIARGFKLFPVASKALIAYSVGIVIFFVWVIFNIFQVLPAFLLDFYWFVQESLKSAIFDANFYQKVMHYSLGMFTILYTLFIFSKKTIKLLFKKSLLYFKIK